MVSIGQCLIAGIVIYRMIGTLRIRSTIDSSRCPSADDQHYGCWKQARQDATHHFIAMVYKSHAITCFSATQPEGKPNWLLLHESMSVLTGTEYYWCDGV